MLAIAGGKGGCGKTTTTLGLAEALSGRVVAVDLDRGMANLHALAEVDREPTLLAEDPDSATHTASDGADVDIVPAPRPGANRTAVEGALSRVADDETAVLLDSPAGATESATLPLRVADRTLLVSTLCAPALRDTAKTAAMARELDAPPCGVVLTRTQLTPDAVSELLDCPVLASIPSAEQPVLNATVVRVAYRRLAERLRESRTI